MLKTGYSFAWKIQIFVIFLRYCKWIFFEFSTDKTNELLDQKSKTKTMYEFKSFLFVANLILFVSCLSPRFFFLLSSLSLNMFVRKMILKNFFHFPKRCFQPNLPTLVPNWLTPVKLISSVFKKLFFFFQNSHLKILFRIRQYTNTNIKCEFKVSNIIFCYRMFRQIVLILRLT